MLDSHFFRVAQAAYEDGLSAAANAQRAASSARPSLPDRLRRLLSAALISWGQRLQSPPAAPLREP
jgi:hypothetical protein